MNGNPKTPITIFVTESVRTNLNERAKELSISRSSYVNTIINSKLNNGK
jgi:hypothetical protein